MVTSSVILILMLVKAIERVESSSNKAENLEVVAIVHLMDLDRSSIKCI